MASNLRPSRHLEVFSAVRDLGPDELMRFLEQCAALLPEDVSFRVREVMNSAPMVGDNLQRALELVRRQWEGFQSEESVQIGVVGPARTGKRTLLNMVAGDRLREERPVMTVIDTQGLDEFLGYGRKDALPEQVLDVDLMLLTLDARYDLTEDTVQMVEVFASLNPALMVVLNKIDLVDKPRAVVAKAKKELRVPVFPLCARRPSSIIRLMKTIVSLYPKALFSLSHSYPKFRRAVCNGIVSNAAFGSALIGAIPIPVSDVLPISAIQISMLLKIARVFGFRIDRGRAKEILPMLVAGYLVREGCHKLRKEFPDQKKLIAVSAGGIWTYMAGQATVRYFERLTKVLTVPDEIPARTS